MGLVAFQAFGNRLVPAVTAVAEQLSVPAGFCLHLLPYFGMAGHAFIPDRFDRVSQRDHRLMGIPMAVETVRQLEMGPIAVTGTANDREFSAGRRVLRMTIQTSHSCPMQPTELTELFVLRNMALDTVLLFQVKNIPRRERRKRLNHQK